MSWLKTIYQDDPKLRPEDVATLMEWTKTQPHLPPVTEEEVILFLHSCYYSIQMSKTRIDNYFTMRTLSPEIFANRDPTRPELVKAVDIGLQICLPQKTPEGYQICLTNAVDGDPNKFVLTNGLTVFDMLIMAQLHKYGPMEGLVLLFDMKGIVFGHMLKLNPSIIKKFMCYLQDAMPIRLKRIHYINTVSFMDKFLGILKPFMKSEVLQMLHLHETAKGVSDFFPIDCLPKDLNGKAPTIKELHDTMRKLLLESVDFFAHQGTQLVDEGKRPGKSKNVGDVFGMEGSFKKLDID